MQVFISWSGSESQAMARALADWLPNVLQAARPWFSPEHLQKGSRWAEELFSVLENSRVGIFCITPSNVHSPWVSFEAAACSTKVGGRVFTLLHRIPSAEVTGPLAIFNHTVSERDDVLRLLRGINEQLDLPLTDAQLQKAFDRWWPDLEVAISEISPEGLLPKEVQPRHPEDIASETLDLTRHLSAKVERLVELTGNPVEVSPANNPHQTRELELEIDGVVERTRSMRYPPAVQEVALQVVDLLRYMFERDWFNKGEPPPGEGVAIARIGQLMFRLKFWHHEDAAANTVQRFFVQLEGDTGLTWHGSTNVAARG